MKRGEPVERDLVLLGGGHAHVQVLRSFGMRPVAGTRLTLVAKEIEAPYSGMLPGLVAGHYDHDAVHIDLLRLARFAGARLVHEAAVGIDRGGRRVLFAQRPPLAYDLLSIDVGITPDLDTIQGAREHAIPVKPISRFAPRWQALERAALRPDGPRRICVVGGGAAGLELVLAARHRLLGLVGGGWTFTLVAGSGLLPGAAPRARRLAAAALRAAGVDLVEGDPAVAVEPESVRLASGRSLSAEAALVSTAAKAPDWFDATDLPRDPGGFLAVRPTLQVLDDDAVFAAGDCAGVLAHPRPKAGVFAVRQGPPLTENLRRLLAGRPPRPFRPQRAFLTLLSLGERRAIAARNGWALSDRWVWRWKDWIDRRFMRRFNELPEMLPEGAEAEAAMRCGGCAAKVGPAPLSRALGRLPPAVASSAVVGLDSPDDAAVLDLGGGDLRVETLDFFRAFWPEPFLFGEIAAGHALNDVFAMGAEPEHALALAVVPYGRPAKVEEDLYQLLAGARACLDREGVALVGGHSSEGEDLALGFFVSGRAPRDGLLRKGGLRPGDRLVLTRPLGTGVLFAAEMRGRARAESIERALATMRRSNREVAALLRSHGARAATDVTGFGLAGHLIEMLTASRAAARLDLGRLPLYPQAAALARAGIASTLLPENLAFAPRLAGEAAGEAAVRALLFDPQTAGGLLAGLPAERADACLAALRAGPAAEAAIVGEVVASEAAGGAALLLEGRLEG